MSAWEAHGAGDTLLTWSSFDEMAWNEFEEGDDRIVPETESLTKTTWALKDESHRKSDYESALSTTKVFDQNFQRLPNCRSGLDSKEGLLGDLNTQWAASPTKERTPVSLEKVTWSELTPGNGPGISNVKTPDTMNKSECSSSMLSSFNGGSKGSRKGNKFETGYEFQEAEGVCKVDSGYQDNDADIVNGSCHFFLTDLCPPGEDLEFFEGVHEAEKGSNMLEFGWGNANNLEDMDKLFLNNEPLLPQAFDENSDGMLWESSSHVIRGSPGSIYEPLSTQIGPEFRALKGDLKGFEMKMEFVPCETSATSLGMETDTGTKGQTCHSKLPVSSSDKLPLRRKVENLLEQRNNGMERSQEIKPGGREMFVTGAESMEDDGTYTPKEAEKGSKARRHAARRKRLEERSKRQISDRKLALSSYHYSQTNKPQLPYMPLRVTPTPSSLQDFPSPSTQISQITQSAVSESPSSMQCLHPVAYVHAGFGFPAHHMPIVVPGPSTIPQQLQQAQPVFIGYQPSLIDGSKSQQARTSYETPSQPPIATMTPQEKIEKLRWRQKMQARLAVEQQQQLINQHLVHEQKQVQMQQHQQMLKSSQEAVRLASTQAAEPLAWNEERCMKAESNMEEGDDSLAATVLEQLLNIASELDTRTRLCLRDGFRRLARSAMQRRAVGDERGGSGSSTEPHNGTCGPESSSSSERSSSSRRILTVADIVETETNPIDRFIAHLLFRKRHTPAMGPVHMTPNSCANIPESSQAALLHQSPWAWQTETPLSEPAAGPSFVNGGLPILQGVSESPHIIIDVPGSSNPCLRFSGTSACVPCPTGPGLGLEGSSPVPSEAISAGVVEDSLVDGINEVSPDTQSLSGYQKMESMSRRHALYSSNGGVFGPASLECLEEHKVADQIVTEDRLPSGDRASDDLLPVDQKEGLLSAAVSGGKLPHLVSKEGTTIGASFRHTATDKELEIMDVDDAPVGTMPLVKVNQLDEAVERQT